MALPTNIESLIRHRRVESARIEYKEGWNPEKVLHALCAFANDIDNWGGGYVILGISEKDGKPDFPAKGISSGSIDKIQKELLEICHLIEPAYLPIVEPVEYQGKNLLVIWAPGGVERPYKCPEKIQKGAKSPKVHYIRKMASTIKASSHDVKELFELSNDVPFDDRQNMQADVADLKVNLMADYLREVGSDLYPEAEEMSPLELGKRLRVVRGSNEFVKPLNVGLLFFNPHPEEFFRCAWIEVVDKPDPTGQGMVEKYFKGPLHIQLRTALDFIRNYCLKEKVFKISGKAEAKRCWNYPFDAIEEALVNAVYHKSYRKPEPIVVTFTSERMIINSIPGPDRSIKKADLDKFQLFSKFERNRRVGEFLKELELAEARNTGYPAILKSLKFNGSPKPIIDTNEDRDYFTFILPVHKAFLENSQESKGIFSAPVSAPVKTSNDNSLTGAETRLTPFDASNPVKTSNDNSLTGAEIHLKPSDNSDTVEASVGNPVKIGNNNSLTGAEMQSASLDGSESLNAQVNQALDLIFAEFTAMTDEEKNHFINQIRKMLVLLEVGPSTSANLRVSLFVLNRKIFREQILNPAIRMDFIEAEPGVSMHNPKLKYYITKRGLEFLKE